MTQLPTTEAEVRYVEHQRRVAWVNEHAWKYETITRRSLRVPLAKALLALARRIAPPTINAGRTANSATTLT